MTVPNPYSFVDSWTNVTPADFPTPYTQLWWVNQTVTDVPESSVGWLVAQGWIITNVSNNTSTTPPTAYYTLTRKTMQNWAILEALMSDFSVAFNEGRQNNSNRYNDVVRIWTRALGGTIDQLELIGDNSNAWVELTVSNLTTCLAAVDASILECRSSVVSAWGTVEVVLNDFINQLANYLSNYSDQYARIYGTLVTQGTAVSTALSAISGWLTDMETALTTHQGYVTTVRGQQDSDLTSHISAYGVKLDAMLSELTTYRGEIDDLLTSADSAFTTYNGIITTTLNSISSDYTNLSNTIIGLLDTADSQFVTYASDTNALLTLLLSDFESHDTASRVLLTNLGTTELARITEQWDNSLSASKQDLLNRGWYSSGIVTNLETRNTREKNEAIGILNDRLAREQHENEHKLLRREVGRATANPRRQGSDSYGPRRSSPLPHGVDREAAWSVAGRAQPGIGVEDASLPVAAGGYRLSD